MYDYGVSLSTRFPQKLWKIVNECKTGAIQWSLNGATILLDYKKFHAEYLTPPYSVFKTNNITSFIRQLNLYGFRKVTSHNRDPLCNLRNPDIHEFIHSNFHRDRMDLLSKVYRKSSGKKRYEKINEKLLSRNKIINNYESMHGMSRLQICQLALKQALKQAVEEYRQKKNLKN
ncbi:heat shock factor protein 5-like [Chelonus insularis]|uniref:heat shock factor protein 5-like n=1 Tax=Chelonus insularis TaxID=460826 RepID=UPI00158AD896|nr:heat shock factor protein 5-like [Chelonus insularis]